jgi:hypothetical protein
MVRQFTEYVTNKLGTTSQTKDSNYVILFSRESNRLILNELELTFSIATTFNLRVVRLSLETDLVKLSNKSKVLWESLACMDQY